MCPWNAYKAENISARFSCSARLLHQECHSTSNKYRNMYYVMHALAGHGVLSLCHTLHGEIGALGEEAGPLPGTQSMSLRPEKFLLQIVNNPFRCTTFNLSLALVLHWTANPRRHFLILPLSPLSMQDIIEQWLKCQSKWLYLEPIFGADEIMKQIPREGQVCAALKVWPHMQCPGRSASAVNMCVIEDLHGHTSHLFWADF